MSECWHYIRWHYNRYALYLCSIYDQNIRYSSVHHFGKCVRKSEFDGERRS